MTRAATRVNFGRHRGIALAAFLLLGASALSMQLGSGSHLGSALETMPSGQVLAAAPASTPLVALPADPAGTQGSVLVAAAPASTPIVASPTGSAGAPASVVSAALSSVTGSTGIDPLDLIVKGVVVAALLYLTLRVLRRLQAGPMDGTHRLEILETRPLGPKASLYLVAVGERRLVVGLSTGGIVSIADLDAAELAAPAGARDVARDGSPLLIPGAPTAGNTTAFTPAGQETVLLTLVQAGMANARNLLTGRTLAAVRASHPDRATYPDAGRRGGTR